MKHTTAQYITHSPTHSGHIRRPFTNYHFLPSTSTSTAAPTSTPPHLTADSLARLLARATVASQLATQAQDTIQSLKRANLFLEAALVGTRILDMSCPRQEDAVPHSPLTNTANSTAYKHCCERTVPSSSSVLFGCEAGDDGEVEDEVQAEVVGTLLGKDTAAEGGGAEASGLQEPPAVHTGSTKFTLTALGANGARGGARYFRPSSSSSSNHCSTILPFKDMFPSSLLQQKMSLQSLSLCFSALKSDVSHHFLSFQDDMFVQHHLVVLSLEKFRFLRQQQHQRTHRRNRSAASVSSCGSASANVSRMSDILAAEKLSSSNANSLSAQRSVCSLPPHPSPPPSPPSDSDAPRRYSSGTLTVRTFPGQQMHRSRPAGPAEVLWQFNFSSLRQQQEPLSREDAGGRHGDRSQPASPSSPAASDTFSFACQLWKIVCFRNSTDIIRSSTSVDIASSKLLNTTYDIKLVRVSKYFHSSSISSARTEGPALLDERSAQALKTEGGCASASAVASAGGDGGTAPPLRLRCEIRLQGKPLLGKPILRKLFADTDTLLPAVTVTPATEPAVTVAEPASPCLRDNGLVRFGADSHFIDESMLARFLRYDNLVVSALLTITATEE